ncbi:peptide pheromone BlpC (bacteriocin-like peptide) [Streptococcus pneumoniae]|nr:peptide pheromone BlpC (bacteriocin-like peptide) [Streptococcus pneumoniae]
MDKKQNLTSFQELTTTELNQITGGGLWEDILYSLNIIKHNNTKGRLEITAPPSSANFRQLIKLLPEQSKEISLN